MLNEDDETNTNPNVLAFRDKKSIDRAPETLTFYSEDERAVFILTLLKQHKFSPEQLFDAKRFIKKWQQHFSFKELVMDLSMIQDRGEDFFYLNFEQRQL